MKTNHFSVNNPALLPQLHAPLIEDLRYAVDFPDMPALEWHQISSLGFGAERDEGNAKPERELGEINAAARLLVSCGKAFSLLCERGHDGDKIAYAIGCPEPLVVHSILRSTFGTAVFSPYTPVVPATAGLYAHTFKALRLNREDLDKREAAASVRASGWVDEVARVLGNFPGMVRLDFHPLAGTLCSPLIQQAHKNKDEIDDYLEISIQSSKNESITEQGNLAKKAGVAFHGEHKAEITESGSVSWKQANAALGDKRKEAEYYARLLSLVQMDGWNVDFTLSADVGLARSHSDDRKRRLAALVTPLSNAIVQAGFTCTWENYDQGTSKINKRGLMLPTSMVPELISMPDASFYGFMRVKNRFYNVNTPSQEGAIPFADILQFDNKTGITLSLPKDQINRHVFVCGMTGSGKTNTVHQLLSKTGNLPFIAIEPVKGEYRTLPGVKAFTMTAGSEHALYLNPFWFPVGTNLQYHIDCLKQIISSAFDLYAAMPNILEQCLVSVYLHCGWDLVNGSNMFAGELPEDMLYPTFSDLCHEIDKYLNNAQFGEESKGNYRGALLSRLQSFTTGTKGMLLNTTRHMPFEELVHSKVVVSLDSLADDADKSIVMGVIIAQYYQFLKLQSRRADTKGLKHMMVIEEAHHLFAGNATAKPSAEGGSGQSSSQELVKTLNNMLAEVRAYGEGFIIVDQSPSALHPAVLKNTGVKIVHRVDYGQDIETMQGVLLLEKDDRELATLEPGVALLRYGGMRKPAKVYIPCCMTKENATIIADEQIAGNSLVNLLLEDQKLSAKIKEIVRPLLNQLLFDHLLHFDEIYHCLRQRIDQQLIIHGHTEIGNSLYEGDTLSEYLGAFFLDNAEDMLIDQYCTTKMIRMFAMRLLTQVVEGNGSLLDAEARAFENYREYRIWPRMCKYWFATATPGYEGIIRALNEVYPELKLLLELQIALMGIDISKRSAVFEQFLSQEFITMPAEVVRAKLMSSVAYLLEVIE
jgi:hypothetical protein